jgi:hypothetical protein
MCYSDSITSKTLIMKKFNYLRFVLVSTSFFFTAVAFAQLSATDIASAERSPSARTITANPDKIALAGLKEVNAKMFKHFSKNYKDASELRLRSVNGGTRVDFKVNGIATGTRYDAKGNWMFTISTYESSKLSNDVRDMVESAYPGFLVAGFVIEVKVLDKKSTLIIIDNAREWKRVRLVDGELSIYEEYKKK